MLIVKVVSRNKCTQVWSTSTLAVNWLSSWSVFRSIINIGLTENQRFYEFDCHRIKKKSLGCNADVNSNRIHETDSPQTWRKSFQVWQKQFWTDCLKYYNFKKKIQIPSLTLMVFHIGCYKLSNLYFYIVLCWNVHGHKTGSECDNTFSFQRHGAAELCRFCEGFFLQNMDQLLDQDDFHRLLLGGGQDPQHHDVMDQVLLRVLEASLIQRLYVLHAACRE